MKAVALLPSVRVTVKPDDLDTCSGDQHAGWANLIPRRVHARRALAEAVDAVRGRRWRQQVASDIRKGPGPW